MISEIQKLFLGNSPIWYKQTIVAFLIINPIALVLFNSIGMNGNFIVGWMFLLEFIFTLALALKCYPLQPGGLLAIEAIVLGLTTTKGIYYEIEHNLEVILLLIFMVAGIYFMKNLMLTIFTKLLLKVKSKTSLSLMFCFAAAILSAFLDALTVTAVLIGVTIGFCLHRPYDWQRWVHAITPPGGGRGRGQPSLKLGAKNSAKWGILLG